MSIAKGSRSKLSWLQEISYGVTPATTAVYTGIPLRNETVGETINTVRSEEIRSDRKTSAVRGGNVRTGGSYGTDFAISRHHMFLKHLLADTTTIAPISVTPGNTTEVFTATAHGLRNGDAVVLGAAVVPTGLVSGRVYYVRDRAANDFKLADYPGGPVAAFTADGTTVTVTPVFVQTLHTPTALTNGLAVTRGTYYTLTISATSYLFLCRAGGTVTTAADLTQIVAGAQQTIAAGCVFENVGVAANFVIRETTIKGGTAFPTQGLAIEKQILGGNSSLYLLFRGCRLNSLELTIPQEGILGCNWGMLGVDTDPTKTAAFSASVVQPTEDPVAGFEAFVSINGGQTNRPVREASLNISNGADENTFCVGQRYRRDIGEGTRTLGGRISVYFEDLTEYNIFANETEVQLDFNFDHKGSFGQFRFSEAKLTGEGTPKIQGQSIVSADYEVTAFAQDATDDVIYTSRVPIAA